MGILNYENIFICDENNIDKDVNVYIYSKSEGVYTVHDSTNAESHNEFLKEIGAEGSVGECHISHSNSGQKKDLDVYVSIGEVTSDKYRFKDNVLTSGASLFSKVSYLKKNLAINLKFKYMAREFVNGIIIASYKYNFLRKENSDQCKICIRGEHERLSEYVAISNAQNFARFLSDTPANLMTPFLFTEYAKDYLKDSNNTIVNVFDYDFIKNSNMDLFLSVAEGSDQKPLLLQINYKGNSSDTTDLCLVGKGITFDSGGISLKPSASMSEMKGDMSGGAAVVSIVKLLSQFDVKCNVKVIVPLTENMPSGRATKPGDVFTGMSGKSVEVDNTDAEGRLILADALAYAHKFEPKYIVDIATLTGAMGISLGDSFIGYFTNDDTLSEKIMKSGLCSNDFAWQLPYSSLYLSAMKSNVADLKNAGGRKGGSATAAAFLGEFIEKNIKWAHIDIAGVMCAHQNKSVYGNGMTGKGVALLYDLIKELCHSSN